MSGPTALGGPSRLGRVLGPAFDKLQKNATWRRHPALVSACKHSLDQLPSISDSDPSHDPIESDPSLLDPLIISLDPTTPPKLALISLECLQKLLSHSLLYGEIDGQDSSTPVAKLIAYVLKLPSSLSDESIELGVLKVLISAVRAPSVGLRGEILNQFVKCCFNIYLGSHSLANQICSKVVLAQTLAILFARAERVKPRTVSIMDMMDLSDKSLNDSSLSNFAQNFINEAMDWSGADVDLAGPHADLAAEDGLVVFKNLCKLSMKFSNSGAGSNSGQENTDDPVLMRGKLLSLELLRMVVENAGSFWRTNEKYLGAVKQYLCLSLLKNSALTAMSVFQLLCSIFIGLVLRFRSGLKEEIGIFFPMLVLRVLENVPQPSFLQKMTVLNLLEKICQDPQAIVDIFVNYDCDVDAPNIFERIVNGLVKTALGVPPGTATSLSPAQDQTFRIESVKCLATVIKSMGIWMDQQLKIGDFTPKGTETDGAHSVDTFGSFSVEEGSGSDFDSSISDSGSEYSDTSTLEQRRVYKLELQKGISLFNRKPSKGIDFLINTKKISSSPESVATFLKSSNGLNPTMIGDYLGDREDFPIKVMHAYVDAFDFEKMDFGEAIRFFLRGFRLPGEAQKIDRIMEKFAERYCKCNPDAFKSADTAYVLAYSVIMLNTDAHNTMVKDKMSKADFIRNNRGIDDGKDLPEEYLSSLYDQIVKNEIKMKADSSITQNKQTNNSISKLLGLDNIFSLVNWGQTQEKAVGANDLLIKHIQEQFKAKSGKSESVFYSITDTGILRHMVEVCWAPLMAAFSVTLDCSDDRAAVAQCLLGFRGAIHVTAVLRMQTQRDAFVTSVAKFTYLHCAADMKQKNIDAVKAIILTALEDGDYLHESWEHVLTCLSRFEHLHLLGEGAPPDASFLTDEKNPQNKPTTQQNQPSSKQRALQNPSVMAAIRGGSYDSAGPTGAGGAPPLVTPEQINIFVSKLNLLDQIGIYELNHIFAHSQRLNGDAIVAFVKALCKVSMTELQSPTDPRIFCLTKIVEIAHYNMNRIRLVWSRIWKVLADFFVSVGLSESLSVAIFVMDSLRQLAMKFLEREELANYNFQNEFLRPFVIVMKKSSSLEVRELIVRCVSQMVLSRVNNIKSGWKGVFTVFTTAAADETKTIVLLAFETMEKIVRDYFPYITETETTTFTDCVKCLITFTSSKFSSDTSLNAIAFLRFCAVKLAEEGFSTDPAGKKNGGHHPEANGTLSKDDHVYFWVPLLDGLAKLTTDPRLTIRKGALEVLFDILKDHGHIFSPPFWASIFESVIYPIFVNKPDTASDSNGEEEASKALETQIVASRCLVDLYCEVFDAVRPELGQVITIVVGFIKSPYQQAASAGVAQLQRLTENLGGELNGREWEMVLVQLKEAVEVNFEVFTKIVRMMQDVEIPEDKVEGYAEEEIYSESELVNEEEEANMETASYAIVKMKIHLALLLSIVQSISTMYDTYHRHFSLPHLSLLIETLASITSHATKITSETSLQLKLHEACTLLEVAEPAAIHFENDSYHNYLKLLQSILRNNHPLAVEMQIEPKIISICEKILHMYLTCATEPEPEDKNGTRKTLHWILPVGDRKEELAARTSLVLLVMKLINGFERDLFERNLPSFFPLFVSLVRCEHGSMEVQRVLHEIFEFSIGPIMISSCS
ncbi:Brefeldin A-inhibited guanine nucleotide-exchange protein 1 [Rhynchospora pubera]|uniref:Brefeldin A-inhibited guanine nucleotide-exchange protein 1 n=1 Tax=Rhynchospora pubera TaxID=906938 RepID=A0AAV8G7U0_9POAL|nr:Brefeldin A-inhibited guanine nucleotide-exchange protein 1 [Rhynchospora pubera]KAJ4799148.1 Brefeldin A-inhibited guanine nucleotide-exchange protein 1 [Rhynchospora pubera]